MSGGGHNIIIMIGLRLCNRTHLLVLQCTGSLTFHCGEVSRRVSFCPILVTKVEAVFLILFIKIFLVKVTVVVFSATMIVNVLNFSRTIL